MLFSLAFSLPGTPVVFYGDEIGMGENLSLPDRLAVRTPMQWSAEANGGFSTAPAKRLVRPLTDGPLRTRGHQRRRPAPRLQLAPCLRLAVDPLPARDARAGVGRVRR